MLKPYTFCLRPDLTGKPRLSSLIRPIIGTKVTAIRATCLDKDRVGGAFRSMSRAINTDSVGKARNQHMRTAAEVIRRLSQKTELDAEVKDMAAQLVFCF